MRATNTLDLETTTRRLKKSLDKEGINGAAKTLFVA